jgi:3-hydroxyacyl-CoA dehydrogenase
MFDWVDRKAAEDAAAGGWPPPKIKPGKIAKNIVKAGKVGAVAIPGSYAYGKWKKYKRNKKKKDKK